MCGWLGYNTNMGYTSVCIYICVCAYVCVCVSTYHLYNISTYLFVYKLFYNDTHCSSQPGIGDVAVEGWAASKAHHHQKGGKPSGFP